MIIFSDKEIKKCNHSDTERALTSSYMISEIEFALQLNYEIISIHECHIYETSSFILRDFVKCLNFFKVKYSDIFGNRTNGSEKQAYCNYLNSKMDLQEPFKLQPNNIQPNKGKRTFYKLMANALFGKFEQKNDKGRTIFVNNQSELEELFFSDKKIQDIFCLNDEIMFPLKGGVKGHVK